MKIVIDIPDPIGEYYLTLFSDGKNLELKSADYLERLYGITYQVLPKEHGDLIDRDKLEKDTEWSEYEDGFISYSHSQIFSEPAVIPADK